ncbi:RNA polymerase sigma factor [Marinicrinis lubricantis]|uniref:RNA polymerase sigma factor n=1 Tax=Marinicrinis lubricantis TaxID=2086470 RepID=A0ABW1IQX7_9BACL
MQSHFHLLLNCHFDALNYEAQKEIYYEFYQFAYGPIYYMIHDRASTEDIIQEAFLKVIHNIPKEMDNENQFKAWIRVVVKNTTYNFLRKHKKIRNEVDAESVFIYDNAEIATSSDSLQKTVETKMMTEAITAYLEELKPEYRTLIELRWRQELSYKEIAETLDTTEQTVKSKLYRAREAMKKRFSKDWRDS